MSEVYIFTLLLFPAFGLMWVLLSLGGYILARGKALNPPDPSKPAIRRVSTRSVTETEG